MYIMFVSLLKDIGYNHNLYLADLNYVCVKKVPDSTIIRQIKCKKSKFSGGACPWTSQFVMCKAHRYYFANPHSPIISQFVLPLDKKSEKNPVTISYLCNKGNLVT